MTKKTLKNTLPRQWQKSYQDNGVCIKVCLGLPLAALLQSGRVAEAGNGEAVLGGEGDPEKRFFGFQSFELRIRTRLYEEVSGFGLLPGLFKSKVKMFY